MTMLRGTLKRKKKKKKIVEDRVKPRAASMAIDVSRHTDTERGTGKKG